MSQPSPLSPTLAFHFNRNTCSPAHLWNSSSSQSRHGSAMLSHFNDVYVDHQSQFTQGHGGELFLRISFQRKDRGSTFPLTSNILLFVPRFLQPWSGSGQQGSGLSECPPPCAPPSVSHFVLLSSASQLVLFTASLSVCVRQVPLTVKSACFESFRPVYECSGLH